MENPEMKFEVDKNGNVAILVDWKKPESREELLSTANRICGLIFHLSTGRMLHIMQKAVSVAAELRGESDIAKIINDALDEMPALQKSKDTPMVPPRKVFNVRNEE